MVEIPIPLYEKAILAKNATAYRVLYYGRVSSTQDVAKALVSSGGCCGTVVVAREQERGQGRLGRTWISPAGGLYLSLILKPDPLLAFRAGIAVAEALSTFGIEPTLKWPNDVLVGESKIAGILIETDDNRAIVGIGVNLTMSPLGTATCLAKETSIAVSRDRLLELVLQSFPQAPPEEILARYRTLCKTIGRAVRIETGPSLAQAPICGKAVGIDHTGRLLVKTKDTVYPIACGDCIHLQGDTQEG